MDANQATSWLQIVQQFGLPLVLFFGLVGLLILAVVVLWRWARPRADQLLESIVELIGTLRQETVRQGDSIEAVQRELDGLRAELVRLGTKFEQTLERLERLLERAVARS
jgi:hypothetical protein